MLRIPELQQVQKDKREAFYTLLVAGLHDNVSCQLFIHDMLTALRLIT